MKNILKIDHIKKELVMDRTFAKLAENTMSEEYAHLQSVRRDYPTYTVRRKEIKKNPNTEHYAGLTYKFMEDYIKNYDNENAKVVLAELEELRLISQCHSQCHRYPTIKKWFLQKYPEISSFKGMLSEEINSTVINLAS